MASSNWSDAVWDTTRQQWYSWRTNEQGEISYYWHNASTPPNSSDGSNTQSSPSSASHVSSHTNNPHYASNNTNSTPIAYDRQQRQHVPSYSQQQSAAPVDGTASTAGYAQSAGQAQEIPDLPPITQNIAPQPTVQLDELANEYKRERKSYFRPGKVFAVLWSEPAGPSPPVMSGAFSLARFGQHAHHEIRRFIVIKNFDLHSVCIPIASYGGRGAAHRPDAKHHSVVHTNTTQAPAQLPDENLTKYAIQIDALPGVELSPTSRVNYSKTYTVENNVRVKRLGEVSPLYVPYVVQYWREAIDMA